MWGNEGSKWSSAGTLILISLLPEGVTQNWLPSLGGCQGRLLRGKSALGKGNQGSAASPAHACLGEPALLLSRSSSFADSLVRGSWGTWVWTVVAAGWLFGCVSWGATVPELEEETETLARIQGGNSIPKSGWRLAKGNKRVLASMNSANFAGHLCASPSLSAFPAS